MKKVTRYSLVFKVYLTVGSNSSTLLWRNTSFTNEKLKKLKQRYITDKHQNTKITNMYSVGLLICTLISENQGLEKLRSVSNLRKILNSTIQITLVTFIDTFHMMMVNCVTDEIRVNLNPVIHMPHMKTSQLPKLLKTYHENWNYTTFFDTFHMMMVNCVTEEIRVNLGPLIFRRRNCFLHYLSLGIWGRKRNSFPSWTGKRMWHTWMCTSEQVLFPIS